MENHTQILLLSSAQELLLLLIQTGLSECKTSLYSVEYSYSY